MYFRSFTAFILLIFLLSSWPFFAVAGKSYEEFNGAPNIAGFRGAKWGADISGFKGLVKLNSNPAIQRYRKKNDRIFIGDAQLQSIVYNFYKGRFIGVSIQAQGVDNWRKLTNAAFEKYGPVPDTSPVKSTHQYEWRAGKSITRLQYFSNSGLVKLWIISTEISGLLERVGNFKETK